MCGNFDDGHLYSDHALRYLHLLCDHGIVPRHLSGTVLGTVHCAGRTKWHNY